MTVRLLSVRNTLTTSRLYIFSENKKADLILAVHCVSGHKIGFFIPVCKSTSTICLLTEFFLDCELRIIDNGKQPDIFF